MPYHTLPQNADPYVVSAAAGAERMINRYITGDGAVGLAQRADTLTLRAAAGLVVLPMPVVNITRVTAQAAGGAVPIDYTLSGATLLELESRRWRTVQVTGTWGYAAADLEALAVPSAALSQRIMSQKPVEGGEPEEQLLEGLTAVLDTYRTGG